MMNDVEGNRSVMAVKHFNGAFLLEWALVVAG